MAKIRSWTGTWTEYYPTIDCISHRKQNPWAVEEPLVEQIASYMWRLERAARVEASIYAAQQARFQIEDETALGVSFHWAGGSITALSRYETTFQRCLFRALDQLEKLQAARIKSLDTVDVTAEIERVEAGRASSTDPAKAGPAGTSKPLSGVDLLGDLEL